MHSASSTKHYRVGLIGVGLMGHGIASNLLRQGHTLTVLEHPGNQPIADLLQRGAACVTDVTSLIADIDVLMLCVTGTPAVEAVMLGEHGALAALRPGTLVIDCSTAMPQSTRAIAAAVQARGGAFLDAPMTRSAKEAAEGRLNLLVGGQAAVLEHCMDLLRAFAENITHVGEVGAGHAMKLLHNFVSLGSVALLCEAAICARQAGVNLAVFTDVLAQGGGRGVALERVAPKLLTDSSASLPFSLSNAQKDLRYYTDMATTLPVDQDIAQAVLQLLTRSLEHLDADSMLLDLLNPRMHDMAMP